MDGGQALERAETWSGGLAARHPAEPAPIDIVADFDRFYEQQYASIHRTVRGIVLDAAIAEDLTQDAFAKAYGARHRYRPDQPPGVWLHRIAVNTAISWARRGQLQRRVLEKLGRMSMSAPVADPTEGRDPELGAALRQLNPGQRAAVVLHFYHGYPYADIGRILGIPTGTVGSRISNAVAVMRRQLKPRHAE
ncbi:MAG TPA: RNA polymerase sigma factor [Candidatus Dormibacteraeota bacterium]|jgi:RNA polymerase sigma-70 factor (ECF subfamily)|nr:RNA polymerase sigma factor [Candidatus Dormibacteraeota bacterium]